MCRDFARVFLWTLLLSSSAVLGRKARLWYRLDAFADFYLQFAGKGGLKSIFTVQKRRGVMGAVGRDPLAASPSLEM